MLGFKMSKCFRTFLFITFFIAYEKAEARDDDDFASECYRMALQNLFSVPMQFTTGHGTLILTVTNHPDEPDLNYIQPHNLKNPGDFFDISHLAFLRHIQKTFANLEYQHLLKQYEVRESPLLPDALKLEAVDLMMEKKPLPEHILDILESGNAQQKEAIDNPILPLRFQTYAYHMEDKYAFPASVVTFQWNFQPSEIFEPDSGLKQFDDLDEFITYINNGFVDHLDNLAHRIMQQHTRDLNARLYG